MGWRTLTQYETWRHLHGGRMGDSRLLGSLDFVADEPPDTRERVAAGGGVPHQALRPRALLRRVEGFGIR